MDGLAGGVAVIELLSEPLNFEQTSPGSGRNNPLERCLGRAVAEQLSPLNQVIIGHFSGQRSNGLSGVVVQQRSGIHVHCSCERVAGGLRELVSDVVLRHYLRKVLNLLSHNLMRGDGKRLLSLSDGFRRGVSASALGVRRQVVSGGEGGEGGPARQS